MSTLEGTSTETRQGTTATLERVDAYDEQSQPREIPAITTIDVFVLLGGVALPAITAIATVLSSLNMSTEIVLRHPVETFAQGALVASIPFGNYLVWNRLRHQNFANVIRLGLLSGLPVGASALVTAVCLAASITGIQSQTGEIEGHPLLFNCCGVIAAISLMSSVYQMRKLCCSWATEGARNSQIVYSLAGILLSLLVVGASEGRQTIVKLAERTALTEDPVQRASALNTLHMPLLDATNELKRDIVDLRSGGLSGMLLGINPTASKQLYFNMTGKPYQSIVDFSADDGGGDAFSSNSYDQFLAGQVIGEVLPGLSLKRSQIRGTVNSHTLTSNLEWTFVLKNKSTVDCEARTEIALPPGAVVSKLTLWEEGKPTDALVAANWSATTAYTSTVLRKQDPALIRYLGKGRVLLQCYPVVHGKEMKVSVTMVAPLKLDSASQASLALPRLMASNYNANVCHDIHFFTDGNLKLPVAGLHATTNADKSKLYVGTIKAQDAKNTGLSLIASRATETGTISSRNSFSKSYTVQTIKEVQNNTPKNLVVVVDGSKSIKDSKNEIVDLLRKVQKLTRTSVLLANSDSTEAPEAISVDEATKQLNATAFDGGHDNLPAVVKSAELAGQQSDSAVLWIHGPQPAINEEIYITSQAASKPSFYELALNDGWTNTSDFLKNHQEIGPMSPVARSGNLSDDLTHFLAQWQPGGKHYSVQIATQSKKPDGSEINGQDALDLSILGSANACKHLIADNHREAAAQLGIAAHIVSPVTAGVVSPVSILNASYSPRTTQALIADKASNNDSLSGFSNGSITPQESGIAIASAGTVANGPVLQNATSGTVGPQGDDATYITGVNTAGTVRINNLANAEAILNIFANAVEILGIVFGGFTIIAALMTGFKARRFALGLAMILFGLAAPGMVNWLMASARDSNLYS
ncbi:MAG: hypothetical protein P4L53_20180 [Candidatus Obscuribacterales bacterium]|nr:hypothetical protein [Candidatus Obscuribacterales bacterium]